MSVRKNRLAVGTSLVAFALVLIGDFTDDLHDWNVGGWIVSEAEARRGRPATPMSYAGVARRSTRRVVRRTSYGVNSIPPSCVYGTYYGGRYYKCGSVYYEKSGSVYIQVVF